mmetsp:Transcript_11567/g.30940  ORF Transcript_11567/g.30940 Transcript_11567/m.30940 type:complete len:471 (-) Transcript_11567:816-2228(-)
MSNPNIKEREREMRQRISCRPPAEPPREGGSAPRPQACRVFTRRRPAAYAAPNAPEHPAGRVHAPEGRGRGGPPLSPDGQGLVVPRLARETTGRVRVHVLQAVPGVPGRVLVEGLVVLQMRAARPAAAADQPPGPELLLGHAQLVLAPVLERARLLPGRYRDEDRLRKSLLALAVAVEDLDHAVPLRRRPHGVAVRLHAQAVVEYVGLVETRERIARVLARAHRHLGPPELVQAAVGDLQGPQGGLDAPLRAEVLGRLREHLLHGARLRDHYNYAAHLPHAAVEEADAQRAPVHRLRADLRGQLHGVQAEARRPLASGRRGVGGGALQMEVLQRRWRHLVVPGELSAVERVLARRRRGRVEQPQMLRLARRSARDSLGRLEAELALDETCNNLHVPTQVHLELLLPRRIELRRAQRQSCVLGALVLRRRGILLRAGLRPGQAPHAVGDDAVDAEGLAAVVQRDHHVDGTL